ncbi:MAG: M20 family metallopeptidase [Bacteroidia bacterium]
MNLAEKVKNTISKYSPNLLAIRRHLHANPELSFQEYKTAEYIEKKLNEIGIKNVQTLAETGKVALIEGKNPRKKVIALRADIDALPITETNDIEYISKNNGVMHACGHDVHTTCLLGAAFVLNQLKNDFDGTVKLIFQPGEEKLPGGASILINEGVLKQPDVDSIIGQHVMPFLPTGKIGFKSGLYMASTDELYITIKGKGGHGAMPHLCIDPIAIAANLITQLQQIVSRRANAIIPSVLSFGKIVANGATNVIPNEVYIEGTFRTLNEEWRSKAHNLMLQMAKGLVESMGATIDFEIRKGYPYLENNPLLTNKTKQFAGEYLGNENIVDLDTWMAAEDFAYYSQQIPACFYRLGTGNEIKGTTNSVHTPNFNIDEDALEIGAGLMAYLAIKNLEE